MPLEKGCYTDPQRQGMSPVPSGGSAGQVLAKTSAGDGATGWANPDGSQFTKSTETLTATQGQTLFEFSSVTYTIGTNLLQVYINGVRQGPTDFTETSTTSITFNEGLDAGDRVLVYF